MRLSEFRAAILAEFGDAYGRSLERDLVLGALGDRTAAEALAAGVPAREVWLALAAEAGVPRERWHGAGRMDPRKPRE